MLDLFREHQFRKTFGGSHDDFLSQPRQVTEWMLAIETIVKEIERG